MNQNLESAKSIAFDRLTNFANSDNFWKDFELAFGENYDSKIALNIKSDLASTRFVFPEIIIVDRSILGSADAAFASKNNTIYTSRNFLDNNDDERIAATLIEEIGHSIDNQINPQDSVGDEGQIFSSLVRGESLTPDRLTTLKSENDHGVINISGEPISIEQAGSIDYSDALSKSILFYEAQQSGKLTNNRVSWRGDSALSDGTDVGRDLSGGYYDAADYVKFGFPMASAMTMLGWGAIQYRSAYEQSGQLDEIMGTIKHATEYIKKSHVVVNGKTTEFWGQVGDGNIDHSYWTSPEIIDNLTKNPISGISPSQKMDRPSFKIDTTHPGSDLAGESAATLAAASILFRPTDAAYADDLLTHAKQLFAFAKDADGNPANGEQRGNYSAPGGLYNPNKPNSPNPANEFYPSKANGDTSPDLGYEDELGWGSIWLYKATKAAGAADLNYFNQAKQYYQSKYLWEGTQSWMEKSYGGMVLMAQEDTTIPHYQSQIEGTWLKEWTQDDRQSPTGTVKYTPSGLAWLDGWGSLRYTANTAFIAGVYADTVNDPNQKYSNFAQSQIEYILGKNPTGMSYMVGFGDKYPQRVHHRAASGLINYGENPGQAESNVDNINDIVGGLVGGPTAPTDNSYIDARLGVVNGQPAYKGNEVALDYNAGFTGALARLYGINNRNSISLLKDNFDAENNRNGADNYSSLTNWNVIRGSIDLIGTGYKQDLLPNNGLYLDLDGTIIGGGSGGKIESKSNFSFVAGDEVTLKFSLAGSQRSDTNTVNVSLGSLFNETFTRDSASPFEQITRNFKVTAPTNGKLIFDHSGGDNLGLLLDNVELLNTTNGVVGTIARNDFNGDRKSDILWQNTNGSVALWQMNSSTATPSSIGALPTGWTTKGTGDFSGDGKADLLLSNAINGSVATWQMNGATVTKATTIGTLTAGWSIAGTGDFNRDGTSDVLLTNTNGTVAQWQMNNNSTVTAKTIGTLTAGWSIAGTGDFNGDSKADILLRNTNGAIAQWQMDGSTVLAGLVLGAITPDWSIAGIADFNGDGKADLLFRNTNGNVAQWQTNGSTVTSTKIIGSATTDWKISGTGDYNGDGKADILWRNDGGGVATWQMDGNNILAAGATSISSAPSAWQIAAPIL